METDSTGRIPLQHGKHFHAAATRGGIVIGDDDVKHGGPWPFRCKPQEMLDPSGHASIIDNSDESEIGSRTDLE